MRDRLQSPTEKETDPRNDLAKRLRQTSRNCPEGSNKKKYGEVLDPEQKIWLGAYGSLENRSNSKTIVGLNL